MGLLRHFSPSLAQAQYQIILRGKETSFGNGMNFGVLRFRLRVIWYWESMANTLFPIRFRSRPSGMTIALGQGLHKHSAYLIMSAEEIYQLPSNCATKLKQSQNWIDDLT